MIRVLVITDEPIINSSNVLLDEKRGIFFSFVNKIDTGFSLINEMKPDIIYIDWMIEDTNALLIKDRCIKASVNSKLVFIIDREDIPFLDADNASLNPNEYIYRPISISTLTEHAISTLNQCGDSGEVASRKIYGSLVIEHDERQAYINGVNCKLSDIEYRILCFLERNRGKVCSRVEILSDLQGNMQSDDIRSIDVYINRLRNKLELDKTSSSISKYIYTVRGAGYKFLKE